jgi:glycosyltransferase involved in cell wall biosynthesis
MRRNNPLSVLSVNTFDVGGGAEKVAMDLHCAYLERSVDSKMIVGRKKSDLSSILEIPHSNWYYFWRKFDAKLCNTQIKGRYRLHNIVKNFPTYFSDHAVNQGKEDFHYPASRKMLAKHIRDTDVFHFHNLHDKYFDLTYLPVISRRKPVLITMHDEYLYTGHCAYSLDCDRWRNGCGTCPYLDTYPAVKQDNTRFNWQKKKSIFSKSILTLVTPSQWLAQRVSESLLSHLPVRVIPNGVDLGVFKPALKETVRKELDLPQNVFTVLYVANTGRANPFKDFDMLDRVIERLQADNVPKHVMFLALGGKTLRKNMIKGNVFLEIPFEKKPLQIAKYYQASDLYVHTSKADNFPLVILEAMACGKAVVSTDAGGIPEQIRDGISGYVVPVGDDEAMALRIVKLMNSPELLKSMGENGLKLARKKYSKYQMVESYMSLYRELIDENG